MLRALFISLVLVLAAPVSFADSVDATSAEMLITEAASELTSAEKDAVTDTVLDRLNLPLIARFTLGKHAKRLEDGQAKRFTAAMETYLREQIDRHSDELSGADVSVLKTVNRNAHDAVVTTRVDGSGKPMTLRWRVIQRAGKWSVVDIEYAGVWLAIEQRAQVSAILDRPGADIDDVIAVFG